MKFKEGDSVVYTDKGGKSHLSRIVCICEDKKDHSGKPDGKSYLVTYQYPTEEWYYRSDLGFGNKIYNWFHKKLGIKLKVGDVVRVHDYSVPMAGFVKATRIDEPDNYYVEYLYTNDDWVSEAELEQDTLSFLKKLQEELDA